MINQQRLLDTFLALVQIDSESYQEGNFHAEMVSRLKKLGCSVFVDKAGKKWALPHPVILWQA